MTLFIRSPQEAAESAMRGFARAHAAAVGLNADPLYLFSRHRHPHRSVGLVAGGGSGHEPMHGGFLGAGMLDAAAPGRVFASPHNRQIYYASRYAAGRDGVLHIVKNYTGDRINFGIAAERLAHDDIRVRRVLVDDDLATESDHTATGRRGTAATVVVEKILGAAADDGLDLDSLADLGAMVAAASRSLAVAARAQTSLQTGEPAFNLESDQLEYGVGIHGERAADTVSRPSYDDLVAQMTTQILNRLPDGPPEVAIVVNGLGAATQIELYGVFDKVAGLIEDHGLVLACSSVGTLAPALDMHGFSLTLTRLEEAWIRWFARPVTIPAQLFGGDGA